MKTKNLKNFYKNKKVLVIGHTGFKGSWLTACLKNFKAKVYGISNGIPTKPSHFRLSNIYKGIKDYKIDIRDYLKLKKKINFIKPDIIFHLAAQSLVRNSFKKPYDTWTTNALGTLNLLEILKEIKTQKKTSVVIVTSDKCYKNINQKKGYLETDILGDKEPYGSSKASAELIFYSYFHSFLNKKNMLSLATARAGNVIGGGDWSKDRILTDIIRSVKNKKKIKIRYPNSTRPWQHVLEPVYGYLFLAEGLYKNKKKINGESFNFGPSFNKNYSVNELLIKIKKYISNIEWTLDKTKKKPHEAGLLNLNCNKSYKLLNWKNILNFEQTIEMTALWYQSYLKNDDLENVTLKQIKDFEDRIV